MRISKINYYMRCTVTIIITTVIISVLMIDGCSDAAMPIYKGNFGIYLLKDSTISYFSAIKMKLEDVELQDEPWLSDRLIDKYDFSSHCIYLKLDKSQFFHEYKLFFLPYTWWFRPFAVVANGKICFWGCFNISYDCIKPAVIGGDNLYFDPKDVLRIANGDYFSKDTRNNEELKNILFESNKYNGGLEITMDSIKITKAADTSIVEYTITIKNIDNDILYIYDYDGTDSNIYSNKLSTGLRFYDKKSNLTITTSKPNTAGRFTSIEKQLYIKLNNRNSIKRRIISNIKHNFSYGNYYCCFEYIGVSADKEIRELGDGRVWMGPARSNILDITFDENNNCRINNRNVIFE